MKLRDPECVNLAPIRCETCGGRGTVPDPFADADITAATAIRLYQETERWCATCEGTGKVPHPATIGRRTLSHSSIGTQLACQKKYSYEYVEKIEPISRKESLALGDAFHQGIQGGDPCFAGMAISMAAKGGDPDRELVNRAIVEAAVALYLRKWGEQDPVNIIGQQATGTQREYDFRVRIRNPRTGHYSRRYDLVGRVDGLVDFGDRFTLEEDKLVGRIDPAQVRKLPLDRQVGLGAYGVWRATGKPVTEIRYRFVRKPQIKQGGMSTRDFVARIHNDYLARPDFYAPDEQKLFRSSDDLLALEYELWEWAHQRADIERRQVFPRNTSSCGDYGGCPFIPLCVGDPDARALYQPKEYRR